jgi:hypothetical protein
VGQVLLQPTKIVDGLVKGRGESQSGALAMREGVLQVTE